MTPYWSVSLGVDTDQAAGLTVCHACSECGGQLDAATPVDYCPQCGIRFEAGTGTSTAP